MDTKKLIGVYKYWDIPVFSRTSQADRGPRGQGLQIKPRDLFCLL